MKTFTTLAAGLALLLLLPPLAGAQTAARLAETGPNDFRISHLGSDAAFDARTPAAAYNPIDRQHLVVWAAETAEGPFAIFGQRLDAASGEALGATIEVSAMDEAANGAADARTPAVIYNPATHEYLAVWAAEADGAFAIYGQRLDAASGETLGDGAFAIAEAPATQPALAVDAQRGAYLVVWRGAEAGTPGASEIYAQPLDAEGTRTGAAHRLSTMGPDGDPAFDALHPAVAFDDVRGTFLVVWEGDDAADGAFEIYGQRFGAEAIGTDDFRISAMGGQDAETAFGARRPAVAFNRAAGEYLVVWLGTDDRDGLAPGEFEIFGQRLDADGAAVGAEGFRISTMGAEKDVRFAATAPSVAYSPAAHAYLVQWRGDDDTAPLVEGEHEIFARSIPGAHDGALDDEPALRLSDMGADGERRFRAVHPALAAGPDGTFLALWSGNDDLTERAIFGQLVDAPGAGLDGFVEVPGEFVFAPAYPNPFNRATTITLAVREAQHVEVAVYDMLGRRVTNLFDGTLQPNQARKLVFRAGTYPSGPYFIRAVGETFLDTKRVVLVR